MDDADFERERIERLRRAMYSRKLASHLGARERHGLEEDVPVVGEDWKRPVEEVPGLVIAPRVIGLTRSILWWVLAASVAFFIIAIGVFVYYFTFGAGANPASPDNIDIGVTAPPEVAGGEPTELQIAVTNRNSIPLQLADLVITFPPGTRANPNDTTEEPSSRISLGTIAPGKTIQGTVPAVFAGEAGDHEDISFELEYHIAGSNAVFVASKKYSFALGSSPVALAVNGNTETVSGQPVQFTVNVGSNASAPLRGVELNVNYPFGFTFTGSDPAPSGQGLWDLGDFAPGQQKTVTLRGVLSGEQGDTRVFRVSAGYPTSTTTDATDATGTESFTTLANNTFTIHIAQPFLGLGIQVNRTTSPTAIASPGQTVTVTINYENNLSIPITNAVIAAQLSGTPVDGTKVNVVDGFYRSTDTTVIWNSTTNNLLSDIEPGAKGSVEFTFQVPPSTDLANLTNPRVDVSVNAAGQRLSEAGVPQTLQSTVEQRITFASDVTLVAQGVYYSENLGSGPLPPKAGTETTYALVLTLINTTNTINDGKVTAVLPPYVRYKDAYYPRPAENVTFDQNTGTFTWDVGTINPGVGVNGTPARQVAIMIGFTPSTSQVGEQPVLVQNVTLTGVDSSTGQTISKKATPDVTTNLGQAAESSSDYKTGIDPGFTSNDAFVVQ